jgi:hypothetical protein
MTKSVYPKYVEHGGELSYPGPVVCEGANLYGFFLEGDPDKLTALCRRLFHDPSGGKVDYLPLSRFIMLTMGTIQKISSASMDLGWSTETQAVFWVPTAFGHQDGSVFFAERIAMLPAYVVVDAFYSLASGREVYGFFKSFGWFDLPAQEVVNPDRLKLDVYGLKEFNPANEAKRWPWLEVSRCENTDGGSKASSSWTSLEEAFTEILSVMKIGGREIILPGLKLVPNLIDDLLHKEVPLVFLKQFRAADHADGAAYQAILEAPTVVQRFNGFRLMDEYEFTILNNLASYPLTNDLGITSQKAILSFKLDMDFIIPGGPTIWQSTEAQSTGLIGFLRQLFGMR